MMVSRSSKMLLHLLLLQHVYVYAFTVTSPNSKTIKHPQTLLKASSSSHIIDDEEELTRRSWLLKTASGASAATAALSTFSQPSYASDVVATRSSTATVSSALCDAAVSTFRNPTNNRIVHLLGTAHISSDSADLAGQLVREIKPSAVFVELDAKRVNKAIPKPTETFFDSSQAPTPTTSSSTTMATSTVPSSTEPAASTANVGGTAISSESLTLSPEATPETSLPKANPFDFKEKILRKSSQVVGNSIKGLYSKLESQGFSAGDEFVVAVREGLAVNSKIVLGDQDVEVTLRRLTEAITKTDLKKLLAADSELEQNMKGLMPDSIATGSVSSDKAEAGMTKEELSSFIETVKTKENVKLLMANLKSVAPEIYMAMVGERDAYMANGLNKLDPFPSIVAVMGIAHVDGVERNLQSMGWVEVKASCSIR